MLVGRWDDAQAPYSSSYTSVCKLNLDSDEDITYKLHLSNSVLTAEAVNKGGKKYVEDDDYFIFKNYW